MPELISRREAIMVAIIDLLTESASPVPVERNRRVAVEPDDAPVIVIFDGSHDPNQTVEMGGTEYEMEVGIEATVKTETDAELGPEVNALYAKIISALGSDLTLGDLCIQTREVGFGVRIVPVEESAKSLAEFSLDLRVEFRTDEGNPYV